MAYDVFISYSRKDMAVADRICEAFDKAGISYFIDRQGIGGGFEFPEVLAENIVSSKLFLLLASSNSYNSKFTTSEIVFAFNKKSKNCIIPYIIDNSTLPLDLELVFAGVNWRNVKDHPIETILVNDVLTLLEREAKQQTSESPSALGKPSTSSTLKKVLCAVVLLCVVGVVLSVILTGEKTSIEKTVNIGKTYKIGDYYDDGKKQGVVFEVSADGQHGKIVSLTEALYTWSSDKKEEKRLIGADDKRDGVKNLAKVKRIANWREKYRAFAWCADLGEGWYLPAIDELMKFTLDDAVRDALNSTLEINGGELIGYDECRSDYWSSTESSYSDSVFGYCAWSVDLSDVRTSESTYKMNTFKVRAVSTF